MSDLKRLAKLKALSDMIVDQHLGKLQACAAARTVSQQRLEGLRVTEKPEMEPIAQAQTMLRYEQWADARRAEINITLARQTAEWMEARKEAQLAFGRAQVLGRLQHKLNKKS
ncbi:hypothetical protein EOK75_08055 [Pseudorhodobacter turbinis]|uniref:Flagellar FliJ protein n=1 Tax=Pseudorhodobacter turbinis TaxID=2500533 RepID=A0A4P8EFV6_9RHOB|nr:hypothetical protein [Pseudorhodobacter turbinis]QCO55697.1 hypothetical protein EOK75_08055 [Pseudorhodobacter turbinis]